jgi:regulator of sigma E protease
LGHFLFARLFKVKVEKFYLFFDPWFSLFRYKPKNSDTEFGLGWLPLGGYVKIAGMIDESMDKEQMKQEPQPWEFRTKPAWQRLLIMIGGALFNILLAFFIYAMVLFTWNDTYLPLKNVTMGMEFSQAALDAGFRDGDILLRADGNELQRFGMSTLLNIADAQQVTVLRNGRETQINMPQDFMRNLMAAREGFASFRFPIVVREAREGTEAARIGLTRGDSIVAVNGVVTPTLTDFRNELTNHKNEIIKIEYYRNNVLQSATLRVDDEGFIGFTTLSEWQIYETVTNKYGFFASFPAGIRMGIQTLRDYVNQFRYVFTREGATSLGGIGTIGGLFPAQWNWHAFWMMTAFLSVILAFMNILPIPALDGGHVMFLLYEVISGRKPNEKFQEYAQIVGMVLLLGLLLWANGLDIFRAIFN